MNTFAAVMTGKGTGAISTIQLFGKSADDVLKKIFKPASGKSVRFKTGQILLGKITEASGTIDQVTIGCEGHKNFAINCHGNPLIVADIMQLLKKHGVKLLSAEDLLTKIASAEGNLNTIALEARLAQPKAKTIQGTKIIANQIKAGLTKKANHWLGNIDTTPLAEITTDVETILKNTRTAGLIIYGCKAVIAGPQNTGKSTLLNCLAGKQKAIVTDIKGTTRDYVTARCQIDSLSIELIDTAGLDEKLTAGPDSIDASAQDKAAEILQQAHLVLLVLDNSQPAGQLDKRLLEKIAGKKILTILNKSDLPAEFDTDKLPKALATTVKISAKHNTGIEDLREKIRDLCGVIDFDLRTEVCITSRQENLLSELLGAKSKKQARLIITKLLYPSG